MLHLAVNKITKGKILSGFQKWWMIAESHKHRAEAVVTGIARMRLWRTLQAFIKWRALTRGDQSNRNWIAVRRLNFYQMSGAFRRWREHYYLGRANQARVEKNAKRWMTWCISKALERWHYMILERQHQERLIKATICTYRNGLLHRSFIIWKELNLDQGSRTKQMRQAVLQMQKHCLSKAFQSWHICANELGIQQRKISMAVMRFNRRHLRGTFNKWETTAHSIGMEQSLMKLGIKKFLASIWRKFHVYCSDIQYQTKIVNGALRKREERRFGSAYSKIAEEIETVDLCNTIQITSSTLVLDSWKTKEITKEHHAALAVFDRGMMKLKKGLVRKSINKWRDWADVKSHRDSRAENVWHHLAKFNKLTAWKRWKHSHQCPERQELLTVLGSTIAKNTSKLLSKKAACSVLRKAAIT